MRGQVRRIQSELVIAYCWCRIRWLYTGTGVEGWGYDVQGMSRCSAFWHRVVSCIFTTLLGVKDKVVGDIKEGMGRWDEDDLLFVAARKQCSSTVAPRWDLSSRWCGSSEGICDERTSASNSKRSTRRQSCSPSYRQHRCTSCQLLLFCSRIRTSRLRE